MTDFRIAMDGNTARPSPFSLSESSYRTKIRQTAEELFSDFDIDGFSWPLCVLEIIAEQLFEAPHNCACAL